MAQPTLQDVAQAAIFQLMAQGEIAKVREFYHWIEDWLDQVDPEWPEENE